ncbi:MAG: thioredoxin family protein [Deltaproteobacteria bacterium]|jgi:thiol:disulfide interchange protein DsbD|nr:thioredoxin family protein [Deltaproteobacteria bacterium]
MKRIVFTCGLALVMLAMVPWASLAKDQKEIGNLLQTADSPSDSDAVQVRRAWSVDRARPGDTLAMAIVIDIKEGLHINADASQIQPFEDFKPYPTKVQVVTATEGITIETARFPQAIPVKVDYASGALMSFEGRTIIYLPMKLDEQIKTGIIELELMVEYQACTDTYCLFPEERRLKETLPVVKSGATPSKINPELFADQISGAVGSQAKRIKFNIFGWKFSFNTASGFGWLLLLMIAALGGFLLNFTPCVLPLIPIKIISLSHAAEDRKRCFVLGLVMALGVLAFWIGLGILIALVSDFTATNQLFQYPLFTILVGSIIGIMALGMVGFFSIRLPQFIYMINPQQDSLRGSFALGILAAVLSTPCTAPFMGAAAAWAATQNPLTTISTFAAIGGGMALPYLMLSAFPNLVNRMPKAGPASELIKQVMGLFMLAAAAYFLGVGISALLSSPLSPPSKIYWWPVMGLVAAGGSWLALRTLALARNKTTKTVFVSLGLILMVLPILGAMRLSDEGPIKWTYYTPERFEAAISQGKTVVMTFTAEWCLNCKALEESVLHDQRIIGLLSQKHIAPIKVDITGNNPAGKAKLEAVGSLTVPLLVIFAPDGRLVFKSSFYTVDQILNAVEKALGGR